MTRKKSKNVKTALSTRERTGDVQSRGGIAITVVKRATSQDLLSVKKKKKTPTGPTTTKKREADRQYRLEEQNTKGSKEEEEPDPFLYRLKVNNVKINWQGL